MATPIPLSGVNCHIYVSHHGRVVMLLKNMCLHNCKWFALGFYSSCCILFLTLKKSQVTKSTSTWSPPFILDYWDYGRMVVGLYVDYMWTPHGTPWTLRCYRCTDTWSPPQPVAQYNYLMMQCQFLSHCSQVFMVGMAQLGTWSH